MNTYTQRLASYLTLGMVLVLTCSISVFAQAPEETPVTEPEVQTEVNESGDPEGEPIQELAESLMLRVQGTEQNDKVYICHYPPGNPENWEIKKVDANGWNGHDGHEHDVLVPEGEEETYQCPPVEDDEDPEQPYGQIISPSDGSTVSGTTTIEAEYHDGDDDNDDDVQWAIRQGSCEDPGDIIFGNVDGHTDSYSWDGENFSATLDFSGEDEGEYCFVFNPTDDEGEDDVSDTSEFNVENEDEEEHEGDAYVVAHKIVCQDESDLPNWGGGGADIGSTTAADFVANSQGRCWFEEGWEFQWEDLDGAIIPADGFYGPAGDWNAFDGGATDSNGMTHTWVNAEDGSFWVREVLEEGYIPFNSASTTSAEIYCHKDVLNYDNYDSVDDPEAGETYHCVAFNTETEDEEPDEDEALLVIHKVVCQDESDLPNWGNGAADIGSTTAADFVVASDGRCWFEEGWEFEWGPLDAHDPADNLYGYAGGDWTTIDESTDAFGQIDMVFDPDGSFYVREVLQEGYIPFSGNVDLEDPEDNFGAEIYCHKDVYKFDSRDRVDNPEEGGTYYCVAFNTEIEDEDPDPEDDDSYVVAHKIVCREEADLPNWGTGGPDIGSTTAADFVANSQGRCWFEEGWEFQWTPQEGATLVDDDYYGSAIGWNAFDGGATDSNGMTYTSIDPDGDIWFREVLQEGYIPFTWFWNPENNGDPVSAEMYCGSDVLNYDNLDGIWDLVKDATYYCVAFNTDIEDGEEPQNTPPVITLVGSSTVYVNQNNAYVDASATVNDAEDDPEPALVVGGLPIDTSVLGTSTVTYDATDSGLLVAVQVTRTVVVIPFDQDIPEPTAETEEEDEINRRGRSGSKKGSSSSSGEVLGATTDNACGMYLLEYMKIDQPNNPAEVLKLQSFLNDQGFPVPVTGFFGPLTHTAVENFQLSLQSSILTPWIPFGYTGESTGYVYKTTRYTINNIVCPGSEAYPQLP